MAKRGRKHQIVYDSTGMIVQGLSFDKGNQSFYHWHSGKDGKKKKLYLGRDKEQAIEKLELFRTKQANIVFAKSPHQESLPVVLSYNLGGKVKVGGPHTPDQQEKLRVMNEAFDRINVHRVYLSEEEIWAKAKELIHKDLSVAARKLGLRFIRIEADRVHTLEEIGNLYIDRDVNPLKKDEKKDTVNWWKEFCEIVEVKTVPELVQNNSLFKQYRDSIVRKQNENNYSAVWVKHRIQKIKTIFRYAQKEKDLDNNLELAVKLAENIQVNLRDKKRKPKLITPTDFGKLLEISDTRWQAILLLSANVGLTPVDVGRILKDDIDLNNTTIITECGKTGIVRCAKLWNRTAEALKEHLARDRQNKSEYLFVSSRGTKYSKVKVRQYWNRLRDKVGIGMGVEMRHLKNTAQTIPLNHNCTHDQVKLLLGHSLPGVADHYLQRSPKQTETIVKVLEDYYFPPQEENAAKE